MTQRNAPNEEDQEKQKTKPNPLIFQKLHKRKKKEIESSEDIELKKHCSFRPTTSKFTKEIYSKRRIQTDCNQVLVGTVFCSDCSWWLHAIEFQFVYDIEN